MSTLELRDQRSGGDRLPAPSDPSIADTFLATVARADST